MTQTVMAKQRLPLLGNREPRRPRILRISSADESATRAHYEPVRGQLFYDGQPVRLRPKTMALLEVFLGRPAELLKKSELMQLLWSDVAVTDVVLHVCITELRQAFDDRCDQPRYIETVHRRGYRFIATVTPAERLGEQLCSRCNLPIEPQRGFA